METIPRSQSHLAALMGISKGFASKLAARGMPTHSLEAAQAWRKTHLNPARTRADQHRQPAQPPTAPETAGHDFAYHRARREAAEATLAELRLDEERALLIRVDAVSKAWAVALATARDALLQIPARMGPVLAAENEPKIIEEKLDEEISRTMTTLVAMIARTHAIG